MCFVLAEKMCFVLTFVSNLEGGVVKQIMRRKIAMVPVRDWLIKSEDEVKPLFFQTKKKDYYINFCVEPCKLKREREESRTDLI